jgi:hypothetical protein
MAAATTSVFLTAWPPDFQLILHKEPWYLRPLTIASPGMGAADILARVVNVRGNRDVHAFLKHGSCAKVVHRLGLSFGLWRS